MGYGNGGLWEGARGRGRGRREWANEAWGGEQGLRRKVSRGRTGGWVREGGGTEGVWCASGLPLRTLGAKYAKEMAAFSGDMEGQG